MDTKQEHLSSLHPWKVRFGIGLLMIILSVTGLIYAQLKQDGAWEYWKYAVPVFSIMAVFLSLYLRRKNHILTQVKFWQEVLHWGVLLIAVILNQMYVEMGIIGRIEGAIDTLTYLSIITILAGIYIDPIFILVGLLQGLFSIGVVFLEEYLYVMVIPLTLLVIGGVFFLTYKKRHHRSEYLVEDHK